MNLGLELKSSGDVKTALRIVQDLFLEDLFRLAHSHAAGLRTRLQTLQQRGWMSLWPTGIRILDGQWLERAELLLGKTPRYLRSGVDAATPGREDFFRSRRDLLDGVRVVDVLEEAGGLFRSVGVDTGELAGVLWSEGQIPDVESVTLGSLVWTAAAQDIVRGRWVAEPLPVELWHSIFPLLTPSVMKETVFAHAAVIAPEEEKRTLLMAYLDPVSRAYDEEVSPFAASGPPDPALVRFFLFSGK